VVSLCAVLAAAAPGLSRPSLAQDYPTRPIRALTATSAGGTSDVFMRVLGEEIRKRWQRIY
jgi:tripartite-type tricarboxylate transporter receptor subunit TctC